MKKSAVLDYFKTQVAVADALTNAGYKISQPAVCKWPEEVPALRAYQLNEITKGAIQDDKNSSIAA